MTDDVVFGNQRPGAEPTERAPAAPNDPAHVDSGTPASSPPTPPTDTPPVEPPVEPERSGSRNDARAEIAARFRKKREAHESQFGKPPFIERQEEEAQRATQDSQAPAGQESPQAEGAAPAVEQPPAAPAPSYTLKVRGKDIPVANRDELLRLAEVEPHEANDFSDAQLTRLAQKHVAASSYIDEGKAFRDQARVAAPAPAGQPAGDQQQQAPPQQQAPSLADLQKRAAELQQKAIEVTQLSDAQEAAKAWQDYETARDDVQQARTAIQTQEAQAQGWRNDAQRDVQAFGERNQDILSNELAQDALLMTATREMGSDLRACGLTDEHLHQALTNPAEMTRIFGLARQHGLSVRTNAQILDAAGTKVRAAFKMPATAAPAPTPTPPAVQTRIDEKRGLHAQPTRPGNPQPVPTSPPDEMKSRKAAVARAQEARRGNNVKQFLAGAP